MGHTVWKIVPICEAQKLDVHPTDLLNGGHFRKCDVSKAGGGYDHFPEICYWRYGRHRSHQFVVQLYGCPLRCHYCYVTPKGIFNRWEPYDTEHLVKAYLDSGQEVFHLMGGAPAIYLDDWPEILDNLPSDKFFHSDLLLSEKAYKLDTLRKLATDLNRAHSLYAVNIKGVTHLDYWKNTGIEADMNLILSNLDKIIEVDLPFYLTFTNPNKHELPGFLEMLVTRYGKKVLMDCFVIDLIPYKALEENLSVGVI